MVEIFPDELLGKILPESDYQSVPLKLCSSVERKGVAYSDTAGVERGNLIAGYWWQSALKL